MARNQQPTCNIPQGAFHQLPQKIRGFIGGYGSGKTFVGCQRLCKHSWEHARINTGYFAPTYPQIRDIFYPTIEEVAQTFGLRADIREGNHEVHLYSGRKYRSTIKCRSMERPHLIVGFKIGHALIDEVDLLETDKAELAFRKVLGRMRYNDTSLKNSVDITSTPEGYKFAYKLFVENLDKKPELKSSYGFVQASTYENEKHLPDDYIQSLLDAYPKELVKAYVRGEFTNLASGSVYKSYNRKTNRSYEQVEKDDALYIGMDFNVEKMAATVYVIRTNGWHAVDEFKKILDTPAMIRAIVAKYHNHKIYVYPDTTGKNRKSVDASTSDIAQLGEAGFTVRARPASPFVKNRVAATNLRFEKQLLWVNDLLAPTVASCLEKQVYDKTGEPDKKGDFDHQNDATSYPIEYEFPIRKPLLKAPITFFC